MPKFTTRHYRAIAEFIDYDLDVGKRTKKKIINQFCTFFKKDNSKFREHLFKKASGLK